jgi:3-dehydroquinate synthetase
MKLETMLTLSLGLCDRVYGESLLSLVDNALSRSPSNRPDFSTLSTALTSAIFDKKNVDGKVVVVAPKAIGEWTVVSLPFEEYVQRIQSMFL